MTQKRRVLAELVSGRSLTRFRGFEMGIAELPARITELRQEGYDIRSEPIEGVAHGVRWTMPAEERRRVRIHHGGTEAAENGEGVAARQGALFDGEEA